jgi:predicted unusual protein kinase regulating ubiquinone biosynthesis (AarF/ABC1/UbiB family)
VDAEGLADQLFQAYLKQILVDGFFHADPHPGNVLITDDGRLALLDLGMVARIPPRLQDQLLRLLLATSEGRADDAAAVALTIGEKAEDTDEEAFRHRIGRLVVSYRDASIRQIEFGAIVLEEVKASAESGIRLPPELAMLGKALLNLDHIGRALDPEFDPNAAIRRHAGTIIRQQMLKGASPASLLAGLMEARDFVERLPARANRILELVSNNDLRVTVDAFDERLLLAGAQKIANRITLGLILAALIVGAALLMSIPTDLRILGYPGIAILFFLAAAGGGLALVLVILVSDVRSGR